MSNYELRTIRPEEQNLTSKNEIDSQQEPQVQIAGDSFTEGFTPKSKPVDRYNIILLIFMIHGIGTLTPWNAFITADGYFRNYKLANNTNPVIEAELKEIKKNFLSYLGLAAQIPNVLFNGLNIIVNLGSGNLRSRVNISLAIEAIVFIITIVLAAVDSSDWQMTFFYVTLGTFVMLNMANGVYQNCIFGTAARFPGTYTNAILIGTNMSGTFTSLVNILSIRFSPDPRSAAIYYFITALDVIVLCLISYNLLPISNFFRYHSQVSDSTEQNDELISRSSLRAISDVPETLRETIDAMVPKAAQHDERSFMSELKKKWRVFKLCWPQLLNVYLTFLVSLAVFPSVLANIDRPKISDFDSNYFKPIFCFLLFNFSASVGNVISDGITWPGKNHTWILVALRFLFIPFFLFCNFNSANRAWPVFITSDAAYIVANILLAISSGYLSSICMMFVSDGLKSEDASIAGMLGGFFLVFGIFSGVYLSLLLTTIVEWKI